MDRIPLHRLTIDASGLALPGFSEGPDEAAWVEYEQRFASDLQDLARSFDRVLSPGALTLDAVATPEASIALALLRRGLRELAEERRTRVLATLRTALECYAHELFDAAGAVSALLVLDTESHHGARRPVLVHTTRGGAWVLKRRPGSSEQLILGADGVFDTVNALSEGRIRLPLLEIRPSDRDPELSWQRWVSEPRTAALGDGIAAATTSAATASHSWERVGQLAGASAAFGITDLGEENVVTRDDQGVLELVPVDTELFLDTGLGLHRTMLTRDPSVSTNHHTGIEIVPRACTGSGPFVHTDENHVVRTRTRSCRRTSSRSLLGNPDGTVGYGGFLSAFVRGMVDAWVVIAQNRDQIAALLHDQAQRRRYLARPTADYTSALAAWLTGEVSDPCAAVPGEPCSPDEARQLRAADVPYLVCDIRPEEVESWRGGMTLSALGPVIRDAVEYVRADLAPLSVDLAARVHLALGDAPGSGTISVGLPGTEQHVVFDWADNRVRLELPEPRDARVQQECSHPDIRDRLLRLQRTDAALRNAWTATEFTDEALHEKLCTLTGAAADWLDEVISSVGWPGLPTVGPEAAHAAAQLVQHLECPDRQAPLVRAMTSAALRGDAAWSDVAGASDSLSVLRGKPQQFGTKFEKGAGGLQPYPLAAPRRIEQIRRGAGLDSLGSYRTRIERHLGALPTPQDGER